MPKVTDMANEALRAVLRHLRRVADRNDSGRPSDTELLERFAVTQRPTEFAATPTILKRVSRNFAPVAQRYANAPGCYWIKQPKGKPGPGGLALGGVGMNYIYDKE